MNSDYVYSHTQSHLKTTQNSIHILKITIFQESANDFIVDSFKSFTHFSGALPNGHIDQLPRQINECV